MEAPKKNLSVALIGNPNCGKSTLFNSLTGLNQKTGNFPGVTVDKKTGKSRIVDMQSGAITTVKYIDLPGTYSLHPKSMDEEVACEIIKDKSHPDHPDIAVVVIDPSSLKRGLFLATQVMEEQLPTLIVLNNMNSKQEEYYQTELLSERLQIPVISINALRKEGIGHLRQALIAPVESKHSTKSLDVKARYQWIDELLEGVIIQREVSDEEKITQRLDHIFTHKVWGFVIFFAILFVIFQSIFSLASYPMDAIESLFIYLSQVCRSALPPGMLTDLFVEGILSGLSGVLVFIPQIALLFGFIAILEESGYMARASFIMDKLMRKFGLNGRSVIPMISGFACAVPAIMGARTISNEKERLITIMITPLMSCSARLPVYILLVSLVIPEDAQFGIFNMQGLVLMGFYLLGVIAALGIALVMKWWVKSKEQSIFIMELPFYRSPRWKNILLTMLEKVKIFVWEAGKIILLVSIILWFLASYAPGNRMQEIEARYANAELTEEFEKKMASEKLEASYAGILGKKIEPVIAPLGYDWKLGIALITSFAAREVFVGTMATIYSVGDEENTLPIRQKMIAEINPETGKKRYSLATALSLMVFYAFAMQCMSTLAIVYRETKKWKWPLIQFLFMGILAYLGSFIVYNLFK